MRGVLFVMLAISIAACAPQPVRLSGTELGGKEAPDFTLTDGLTGDTVTLSSLRGNVVALAQKMASARLGALSSLLDYNVFAVCSDGDLMEGVAYEAASLAGHLKLDNLVVVYDDNRITIDGGTEMSFTEDVGRRFEGLGWTVQAVDGHDSAQVHAAIEKAKTADRPALVLARTHIGFGSPSKQGKSSSHGSMPGAHCSCQV